jgi:hypothetical protein
MVTCITKTHQVISTVCPAAADDYSQGDTVIREQSKPSRVHWCCLCKGASHVCGRTYVDMLVISVMPHVLEAAKGAH